MVTPLPNALAHQARAQAWCVVLAKAGWQRSPDQIIEALEAAFGALDIAWEANVQSTAVNATDFCLDRLDLVVPGQVRAELVSALEQASADEAVLTPNIHDALARLKNAGPRLGVISDIFLTPGSTWAEFLLTRGIGDLIDHWTFSDAIRAYKPSRLAFDHAAAGLGVNDPARLAHVGDLRRTDVGGARGAGWWSVHYSGVDDDRSDLPDADFVIKDHLELLPILGL